MIFTINGYVQTMVHR